MKAQFVAASLVLLLCACAGPSRGHESRWITGWTCSPGASYLLGLVDPERAPRFSHQTLRQIVHLGISGTQVRIRFSNAFGAEPLRIGEAHAALRAEADRIDPGTDRKLLFGGQDAVTIPPGSELLSDPVALPLPAASDLAISIYLPGPTAGTTLHDLPIQTNYLAEGNLTGATALAGARTFRPWYFLSDVELVPESGARTVIAFGDSLTDGAGSTADTNRRWTDVLARRLAVRGVPIAVANRGLSGGRLLYSSPGGTKFSRGDGGLERFDREVLATPGVSTVIVFTGANDLGRPGADAPASEEVSAKEFIAALQEVIARSHAHGLRVLGGTLLPREGNPYGHSSPSKEKKRQLVNEWIRAGNGFDGVLDFDRVARDPTHPARLLPEYDSGDHLHLNDRGYEALGDSVDLALLRGN